MAKNKGFFLLFISFLTFAIGSIQGQNKKFVVFFKDKKGGNAFSISNPGQFLSPKSIQRRLQQNLNLDSTDLPVSPSYLDGIRQIGANVLYQIKWQNGAIIDCPVNLLPTIQALPYVLSSKALNSKIKESPVKIRNKDGVQSLEYGQSLTQNSMIGIDSMHSGGFHGENKLIVVMDAGFQNVNGHVAFAHLFQNQKIVGIRDLVDRDGDVYSDHWHGAAVLSNIAGYMPGQLIGGAFSANFFLIRSEDAATENEIECAYWSVGIELADSIGADVVNSSLGYTTFDTQALDYSISMLDGKTTIASKSAVLVARKGMVLVTSAGNEGNNSSWGGWISAPADADSVLTAGSVNAFQNYSSFSGKGPTADGRIKPDLVAMGASAIIANVSTNNQIGTSSGTSFSAPILTGLVAGFWQANPNLSAKEIITILKSSGSNRLNPNNQIGWGLPNFSRAQIITGYNPPIQFPFDLHIYPNPSSGNELFIEMIDFNKVGNASFEITDFKGALFLKNEIKFDEANQKKSIVLPTFAPGLYNVKVEVEGKQFLKKILLH